MRETAIIITLVTILGVLILITSFRWRALPSTATQRGTPNKSTGDLQVRDLSRHSISTLFFSGYIVLLKPHLAAKLLSYAEISIADNVEISHW